MTRNSIKRHRNKTSQNANVPAGKPEPWDWLPWENSHEHEIFQAYLYCPKPRSVRDAYRKFCEDNGKTPKSSPPSNWYQVADGKTLLIRKTEQRVKAIETAERKYHRVVDWEAIEAIVWQAVEDGELDPDIYDGPYGEIMRDIKSIEVGFMSLAIDLNGEPLPGVKTWSEQVENERGGMSGKLEIKNNL